MTKQIDVVVVYTAGSLLRVLVTGAAAKIMFEDLPYVDRIMEMIHVGSLFVLFHKKVNLTTETFELRIFTSPGSSGASCLKKSYSASWWSFIGIRTL